MTFQLPALMAGENIGGLTVVISPLLSLMKDQVDNLYKKGITTAAYINSLLNPIERKDTIDRVLNGNVDILYIAPESLRSRTIERLLLKRQVVRFVIDEAHCFSTWGHDFRVDYLYIGDFIKNLMKKKELTRTIPVSCFTATAKQDVIDDIKNYFNDKLDLSMKIFKTESGRKNLEYNVIKVDEEEDRYYKLRNLLEGDSSPTIIYASRTKIINKLHERLNLKLLVFSRALNPESKKKTYEKKSNYFFELKDFSLDGVYRSLDHLTAMKDDLMIHLNKEIIGQGLKDVSLVFYDVTNYYFESMNFDGFKERGVSKESKDTAIVQMGLFIDNNGIPITYELFSGNTNDLSTMRPILDKI